MKMSNARSREVYSQCYADPSYQMGTSRKVRMLTAIETCVRHGMLMHSNPPYSVLDVGCGRGELLRALASAGDPRFGKLAGLEIVPELTGSFQGYDVGLISSIANLGVDAQYAIVTCSDVLEHVDPSETSRALGNLIQLSRGVLILHVAWFSHVWTLPNGEQEELHINRRPLAAWVADLYTAGAAVGRHVAVAQQEFPGEVGIITVRVA